MHTVLKHEILFSFTFAWPLSIFFSFLVLNHEKKLRFHQVLAVILGGPAATLFILWRQFVATLKDVPSRVPMEAPRREKDEFQRFLRYALFAGLSALLITGCWIFLHPGWTDFYYALLKGHAYFGYAVWAVFFVYIFFHSLRGYKSRLASVLTVALALLVTAMTHTLNVIDPTYTYFSNIPLFFITWALERRLRKVPLGAANPTAHAAGLGLLMAVALTFATGAYIAEPFNTLLNNNMGLYVVYIHGAVPLVLLPWAVAMSVQHMWPRLHPDKRKRARRVILKALPVYGAAFVLCSLYAHWKWFGLDAGSHYWPPSFVKAMYAGAIKARTAYETHSGPPPAPAKGAYPEGYDKTLNDYSVCANPACHASLVAEWKTSSHRFAASNLFFRDAMERMASDMGGSRLNYFCVNCHDPTLVLNPDRDEGIDLELLKTSEGVSCKACHTMIQSAGREGPLDGFYELRPEVPYPVKVTDPDYLLRWPRYIRWDLRLHFRNYSIPELAKSGELCASCHVASMPAFVTGLDKDLKVTDLYTSWKESEWAKRGETCVTCHMPYRSVDERAFYYPDHRIPGINEGIELMVADAPEPARQDARVLAGFVKGLNEGKSPWPDSKPFLTMAVEAAGAPKPGEDFEAVVKTTNSGVGHYFHAGPNSLNQFWIEFKATDAAGAILHESGKLAGRELDIEERAHRLGARILDADGGHIEDCSIWKVAGVAEGSRKIHPFETVEDRYEFFIPENARLPITVKARWNYRRASQRFVNRALGGLAKTFPVVEVASVEKTLSDGQGRELSSAP